VYHADAQRYLGCFFPRVPPVFPESDFCSAPFATLPAIPRQSHRLLGADERTHELAFHLRRNRVCIHPMSSEELPGVLHLVDPCCSIEKSSKPAAANLETYSESCNAPATHPTHSSMFRLISAATSPFTTTPDTAKRPPGQASSCPEFLRRQSASVAKTSSTQLGVDTAEARA